MLQVCHFVCSAREPRIELLELQKRFSARVTADAIR